MKPDNPQPSEGGPNSYLIPHSREPQLNALYATLLELGWRFSAVRMTWHAPEADPYPNQFGRLEYAPDFTWATVQPPTPDDGQMRRPPALLRLRLVRGKWWVTQ